MTELRRDALAIYGAAIAGVEPGRALTAALAETAPARRVWIIAVGKAARPMATAAVDHLDRLGIPILGGLVATPDAGSPVDQRLRAVVGDHPLPGDASLAAAEALGDIAARVGPGDEVWVLLSGGATSLTGAPVEGILPTDYRALVAAVGRAGLPIGELNRIRKRFSRWGAGRLAVALGAERVRVFVVSDVPGDDLAAIGSGPCQPDASCGSEIRGSLDRLGLASRLPASLLGWLDRVAAGELPETPKPDDPAFRRVTTRIVASNGVALDWAADRAAALGYAARRATGLLDGEAADRGAAVARLLLALPVEPGRVAWIGGGETTVTLGSSHGAGGRCQEFALAAVREFAASGPNRPIVLLAGGTDGRDGPTDAAGAIVDPSTWGAIIGRGIDPEIALGRHDGYPALDAVGSLIRTGFTGTNVMDVVVGLVGG